MKFDRNIVQALVHVIEFVYLQSWSFYLLSSFTCVYQFCFSIHFYPNQYPFDFLSIYFIKSLHRRKIENRKSIEYRNKSEKKLSIYYTRIKEFVHKLR